MEFLEFGVLDGVFGVCFISWGKLSVLLCKRFSMQHTMLKSLTDFEVSHFFFFIQMGSSLSTICGIWKKSYNAKFVKVGTA